MATSIRPLRLLRRTDVRSTGPDQLQLTGRGELQHQLDAEALAAAQAIEGKEDLTAAWSKRPSRLLGQRYGEMTYKEGIRLYISQGAAMQHTAADTGQAEGSCSKRPLRVAVADVADAGGGAAAAHELLAEASRRGLVTTEQQCRSAVEAAMQHLPDVESHLEPEALALVLSNAPTSKAAVHVAALADAAWRRVPSRILGPRPGWMDDNAEQSIPKRNPKWAYGNLLRLSAAVGYERVKKALAQPCMELACLELHPFTKEERLKLDTGIENVERISGLSLPKLLERRPRSGTKAIIASGMADLLLDTRSGLEDRRTRSWDGCAVAPAAGSGLEALNQCFDFNAEAVDEIPLTAEWDLLEARERVWKREMLQLECIQDGLGQRAVEFSPPISIAARLVAAGFSWDSRELEQIRRLLPPLVDISNYELPASVSTALLAWAEVRCGRDLKVKGWGPLRVSLEAAQIFRPGRFGSILKIPPPAQVRAHGYAAARFPAAHYFATLCIHKILADPGSPLAQYIIKWSSRLNGPLAARIHELEAVELGELEFGLPPETLLRRLERAHVQRDVPLEQFDWLAAAGQSEPSDGAHILTSKTDSDGATLHVLLLTTSHQIAMAGRALKNCVGHSMLESHISDVRGEKEMLLVLCPGTDIQEAKAMALWRGEWTEIYEACNQPIRPAWKDMFVHAEAPVRRIWDARPSLQHLQRTMDQLMSWDHPGVNAAIAGSNITKSTFAADLAALLGEIGAGNRVRGSELAVRLQSWSSSRGCSELFCPGHYCGFSSLKEFTAALPFPAVWDDGSVTFKH